MSNRLPFPLAQNFDPSGPYRNPGQTNPLPSPSNIPTPCWFGGSVPVTWSTTITEGLSADIQLQAHWASPIFDMRPDIRNVTPNTSSMTPGHRSGVPMWNRNAHLWVQFENPNLQVGGTTVGVLGNDLRGFQVLMTEEAHVSDPQFVQTVSEPEDITAQFTARCQNSSVLSFYPVGDANPLRFYRLRLTFNVLKRFINPEPGIEDGPAFNITSAMY